MDKAKILRQCNEIERAVNELYVKRQDSITSEERISLINMLGVIVTEITTPPKNNADRIRYMTDDELAMFLQAVEMGVLNDCPDYQADEIVSLARQKLFLATVYKEESRND